MAAVFNYTGWSVVTDKPLADRPTRLDAILIPMFDGGFRVLINPTPIGRPPSTDWLLAHEYAHTLFYSPGAPPTRSFRHTAAEEEFCDRFATTFTGVAGRSRDEAA